MTRALYALSAFKDPEIVLFHVVEMPSRTVPIEVVSYKEEITLADEVLSPICRMAEGGQTIALPARRSWSLAT